MFLHRNEETVKVLVMHLEVVVNHLEEEDMKEVGIDMTLVERAIAVLNREIIGGTNLNIQQELKQFNLLGYYFSLFSI